jgi:hypothetical protein
MEVLKMSMITVDSNLVRGAMTQLPTKEYIELLRDATAYDQFDSQLHKDLQLDIKNERYVRFTVDHPGMSMYRKLIKDMVISQLAQNEELVWALYDNQEKWFNYERMTFDRYKFYDDGDNKFSVLEDDDVKEIWVQCMMKQKVMDIVHHYDADELGSLIVKVGEYVADEQIPQRRRDRAGEVLAKLTVEVDMVIGREDAEWLMEYGFIAPPEVDKVEID